MGRTADAGRLAHPDGARNQIESGIQQAASWTLLEELKHHGSEVTTTSWRDYPLRPFATPQRLPTQCMMPVEFQFGGCL